MRSQTCAGRGVGHVHLPVAGARGSRRGGRAGGSARPVRRCPRRPRSRARPTAGSRWLGRQRLRAPGARLLEQQPGPRGGRGPGERLVRFRGRGRARAHGGEPNLVVTSPHARGRCTGPGRSAPGAATIAGRPSRRRGTHPAPRRLIVRPAVPTPGRRPPPPAWPAARPSRRGAGPGRQVGRGAGLGRRAGRGGARPGQHQASPRPCRNRWQRTPPVARPLRGYWSNGVSLAVRLRRVVQRAARARDREHHRVHRRVDRGERDHLRARRSA